MEFTGICMKIENFVRKRPQKYIFRQENTSIGAPRVNWKWLKNEFNGFEVKSQGLAASRLQFSAMGNFLRTTNNVRQNLSLIHI